MASGALAAAMSAEERPSPLTGVATERCGGDDGELRRLLVRTAAPVCYEWFDPSPCIKRDLSSRAMFPEMHIAEDITRTVSVNKMVMAGCKVKVWMADWSAQMDGKMAGDPAKIRAYGRYMIEIRRAVGMDMNGVEFLWWSDEVNRRAAAAAWYWSLVMDIARRYRLSSIKSLFKVDLEAARKPMIYGP